MYSAGQQGKKDACSEVRNVEEEKEPQQQQQPLEVQEVGTLALFLCMLQLQPSPRLFVWPERRGCLAPGHCKPEAGNSRGQQIFQTAALQQQRKAEGWGCGGDGDDKNNKSWVVLIQQA